MRDKGTLYIFISAVFFSLAGILIKSIAWSSLSISGARSFLSMFVILIYMKLQGHKFVLNKAVLIGAACNFLMSSSFVIATKMTSATNAIVLQFTEPVFIIIAMWLFFGSKPRKDTVITCIVVFAGILCFFFDRLTADGLIGNLLAIFSGIAYTGVFLIKKIPGSNFESSLIVSHLLSILISLPFIFGETDFGINTLILVLLLGVVQYGLSYVFLSIGLDRVSPVSASLTSTIEPILNPIIVALFMGERLGPLEIIGGVLVLGASTLYNLRDARLNPVSESNSPAKNA